MAETTPLRERRITEFIVALHAGLDRLGPGDDAATRRALRACRALPCHPEIVDIGCGAGAQTLVLSEATGGRVVAVDRFPQFLARLQQRLSASGIRRSVKPVQADMAALPFRDRCFDLVWSEGAAYVMGFDRALAEWRRLLRPGGYLVVSEAAWFRPGPPPELARFWRENYPAMRAEGANIEAAERLGWRAEEGFRLPFAGWQAYYAPLRERLRALLDENPGDAEAEAVVELTEREMALMEAHRAYCGYAFYVLRRVD